MTEEFVPYPTDDNEPEHRAESDVKYSRSRKAWNAAVAAAVVAGSGVSVSSLFTDRGIDGAAVGVAAGAIVTAFVGTFLVAFFSTNES